MMSDEKEKRRKDKECIMCEHIFECPGKPESVNLCIEFKERTIEEPRKRWFW